MNINKTVLIKGKQEQLIKYVINHLLPDVDTLQIQESEFQNILTDKNYNTPRNSWTKLVLPISNNKDYQNLMLRFDKKLRIGRILEILDLLSGFVSYKHCNFDYYQNNQVIIVTACADNVKFYKYISPQEDIVIQSYVCYVGKSSIEVQNDIYQQNELIVIQLKKYLFFYKYLKERNLHNKIFGGFLARILIEAGWLCGYYHVKGQEIPEIVNLTDIQFIEPVNIGDSIQVISHVSYILDNYMDVKIQAKIVNPTNIQDSKVTTGMHLILKCQNQINDVIPQTYEHGILYLEGKRLIWFLPSFLVD
ncbi:hypothetical protein IMG5_000750 [Ichthyophthirius multifiliis]|uniref:HotDog ACOT-type domain-containing protein n=1 Tax=Ichthyophthirius multifiliis TaxID=5932 RepID=G0QIW2_ICHMU|nr:hypothetical protein IMG5_000750 [Ichthyophthirius multifiliis]EGR34847.1 hypothetical protein IMG5_000750 [Ichthyophthirius multifiliis]|eukprot:XP_004040151.1 hypothetical protein IMG5_000750 [Ichthyophthirius multifiliis]